MDTIIYKGKEYPTRTFEVKYEGEKHTHTIATESLATAIGIDDDYDGSLGDEEENIDQSIYFYVEDEVLLLDAKEICLEHLDIPMKFISE